MFRWKRRAALSAAAAAAWAVISPATLELRAATVPWTNASGGNFSDIANWNSGAGPVPGIADDAQFTLASTYTATLDLAPSTTGLTLTAGDVTFVGDATPRTYNATNVNLNAGTLRLGASPAAMTLNYANYLNVKGGAALVVSGGNDVTTFGSAINLATVNGAGNGAIGSITVDGAGSSFVANNTSSIGGSNCVGSLTFSNDATGTFQSIFGTTSSSSFSGSHLTVASGAELTVAGTAGYVQFGTSTGHASQLHSITVTGAGSTFTQSNGFFTVGGGLGTTTFTIADGGAVTTAGGGYSLAVNSKATMDITGGTLNARGAINVGGGVFKRTNATGVLNWPDGFKGISVTGGGTFDWFGALSLATPGAVFTTNIPVNGANSKLLVSDAMTVGERISVTVGAGGMLAPASLAVGGPSGVAASVIVDGAGASLTTGAATIGGSFLTANLAFRNNATGAFTGLLSIHPGSQGSATIESGADVTAANVLISPMGSSSTLTVTGAGSTLTQTATSTLTIGQSSTLLVTSGGVATTGTGLTSVTNGGLLTSSGGGTINVSGDISVTSGSINGLTSWATGRTMTINNGTVGSFGDLLGLSGNTISVSGNGSVFSARDIAFKGGTVAMFGGGGDGTFRTMQIASDGSIGSVTVDGANSVMALTSTSLTSTIGADLGTLAELQVLNDATFNAADGSTLVVKGSGTVNIAATHRVRLATVTLDAGEVTINAGGTVSVGPGLTMPNGGQMTIQEDGKLIVRGGNVGSANANGVYDGVTGLIQIGRSGGDWAGAGITTSELEAEEGLTSIAIATAESTSLVGGTFGGVSVASGDVLVMYTYAGDANLDGFISGDDYSAIDFNIIIPGAFGWSSGDFNYDGIVSGDDYATIDFNIVAQGAPFSTSAAGSLPSASVVAVPEPSCALMVALASMRLIARRRRSH